MLVVKIEMWPKGNESKAREIGRAYITNVGQFLTNGTPAGNTDMSNYDFRLYGGIDKAPWENKFWKRGTVYNFRRSALGAWDLLFQALRLSVGQRNV